MRRESAINGRIRQHGYKKKFYGKARQGNRPHDLGAHESIIHGVAVLEALEKSVASTEWEKVAKFEDIR